MLCLGVLLKLLFNKNMKKLILFWGNALSECFDETVIQLGDRIILFVIRERFVWGLFETVIQWGEEKDSSVLRECFVWEFYWNCYLMKRWKR